MMGEANEKRNVDNISSSSGSFSLEVNKYPRDLLQRFNLSPSKKEEEESEEAGIELKLGLSLGGKFGVDKTSSCKQKLKRSSSIAGSMPFLREGDAFPFCGVSCNEFPKEEERPVLMRTSSLPVETEEEWRKRKEMQSLRRLEAKRRRNEKQFRSSCGSLDFDRSSVSGDTKIAAPFQERINEGAASSSVTRTSERLNRTCIAETDNPSNSANEIGINSMADMPCVFTKGEGPNGRRVDGILYKYGRGEEVRIMCVCHGKFHSPAEFVKHAGGGDVDHPLRHIVINPAGPSL